MRRPGLLITLLIVATVLVDLVALSVVPRPPEGPHPAMMVLYSLSMAQVSLVALWAGLGGKSAPWRVIGLVLVVVLWSALLAAVLSYSFTLPREIASLWTVVLLVQAVAVFISLSVARAVAVRLVSVDDLDSVEKGGTGRSRLQFSLAYLLGWTTAVAVTLGLLKYTVDYRTLSPWLSTWRQLSVLAVGNPAIALVALWALLGSRWLGLRVLLLCLTAAAAIASERWLAARSPFWVPALLWLVQALWLAGSLAVFRVCGYRVVRRRSTGHAAPVPDGQQPVTATDEQAGVPFERP